MRLSLLSIIVATALVATAFAGRVGRTKGRNQTHVATQDDRMIAAILEPLTEKGTFLNFAKQTFLSMERTMGSNAMMVPTMNAKGGAALEFSNFQGKVDTFACFFRMGSSAWNLKQAYDSHDAYAIKYNKKELAMTTGKFALSAISMATKKKGVGMVCSVASKVLDCELQSMERAHKNANILLPQMKSQLAIDLKGMTKEGQKAQFAELMQEMKDRVHTVQAYQLSELFLKLESQAQINGGVVDLDNPPTELHEEMDFLLSEMFGDFVAGSTLDLPTETTCSTDSEKVDAESLPEVDHVSLDCLQQMVIDGLHI